MKTAIYDRLPVFLQHMACTLVGLKTRRERYTPHFHRMLDWLTETDTWPVERLLEYQNAQLRNLVQHCYETVPYYHSQFDELGIKPDDIRSVDDLKVLPILTKETVRANREQFISSDVRKMKVFDITTSGTTGAGMRFTRQRTTEALQYAVYWRFRQRFGAYMTQRHGNFGGKPVVPRSQLKPPFWRHNFAMHQTYFSTYHLSDETIPHYLDYLDRHRHEWFGGYPSALATCAKFMLDTGRRLRHRPHVVCTGSESLLPFQERWIEEAFGCPVVDTYGAAEMICSMSRCPEGVYHVDMELGVIEPDPIEVTDEGTVAKIIGTGLQDMAMPLLRYDIGDVATFIEGPCPCGLTTPMAVRIEGRTEGCIRTPDGRVIGRMARVFVNLDNVHESQIVQDQPDHLTVRVVRFDTYTDKDEQVFEQRIRSIVGSDMAISFQYVPRIPREKNGKFKAVINVTDAQPSGT